ncbi:MAG TPA: 16S rRNA (cytosine(1402)-N(4))-methyltransferase RsmH [Kofleriaceae bacterium]|nr:16S rRNA (cytosine(1402)-N(4))-methyltransferase RsmH [Kofleriaceae bacterium]
MALALRALTPAVETPDHIPVLLDEVLDHLSPKPGGTYVDGTFGRGGHTRAVLDRIGPTGRVIALDRDPDAIAAGAPIVAAHTGEAGPRLTLVHARFGEMADVLARENVAKVDGILLDLGVSSPQLDEAARGFSFSRSGPIDMRMDPSRGPTALELIRDLPEPELADILRDLGEERLSKRIARRLQEAERAGELATTLDLARVVSSCFSAGEVRKMRIHPATRTFQGLRIAVNGELDELATFLDGFPDLLAVGGRCVVISFHSLEDRLVKRRFRDLAWTSSLPPQYADQAGERVRPVCTPVSRKAVFADDAETDDNPRARSARLRACERTDAPNLPAQRNSPHSGHSGKGPS